MIKAIDLLCPGLISGGDDPADELRILICIQICVRFLAESLNQHLHLFTQEVPAELVAYSFQNGEQLVELEFVLRVLLLIAVGTPQVAARGDVPLKR